MAGAVALVLVELGAAEDLDLRIQAVELQIVRDHRGALEVVEARLSSDPDQARRLGLEYLRGHLLLRLERHSEALQAFASTMSSAPQLGSYSRYRLAVEQDRLGHPEVAAGLVATLLAGEVPRVLIRPSVDLLHRSLKQGGDCRVLRNLESRGWKVAERRRLELVQADCALRGDQAERARELLKELLETERGDPVARGAAERLQTLSIDGGSARDHLLIGLAFYRHREFDSAMRHLQRTLGQLSSANNISRNEVFECRYAVARSHFWEGRHETAARAFGLVAAKTADPRRRAQALYQQGRSLELADQWPKAGAVYQLVYQADPTSGWAGAALMSFMRLQWLQANENQALQAYAALGERRWRGTQGRAALFLATSDLATGRTDRASGWLGEAASLGIKDPELSYWQGRRAETAGLPIEAVERYLKVLRQRPLDPFAEAARSRLKGPVLAAQAARSGLALAASSRAEDLYRAWLLLGDEHPRGAATRRRLEALLAADRQLAPYLKFELRPTASWPLWQAALQQPEEMLLALGVFEEGASVLLRHFPVADPELAYTGSLILAQAGNTHRSLYVAEVLAKRIPKRIPQQLMPVAYRRLLYPLSYSLPLLREAERHGIDPLLLAGVIREESRFDPNAFSAAAARGLTQFVFPTARRIAPKIGIDDLLPADLDRPEVAIALGAAYLAELGKLFAGSTEPAIAAYNAGELQAALWQRYCLSNEPEEYLTKVAFQETRNYLTKVLTSRNHYRDLYAVGSAAQSRR